MNKKLLGLAGALVAAGGITAGVLLSGEDPIDPNTPIGITEELPYEIQIAERHFEHNGKKIRVVGGKIKRWADVEDNELGRTVEVEKIDKEVMCNVVLEGEPVPMSKFNPEFGDRKVPDIETLKDHMGKASLPVMINCPKNNQKKCLWTWLATGDGCIAALDSKGYIGSSIEEFIKLPEDVKQLLLEVAGTCKDPQDDDYPCHVPYGDPRANIDGVITFPHSWGSGGGPLNFAKAKNGKSVRRYKEKDYRTE